MSWLETVDYFTVIKSEEFGVISFSFDPSDANIARRFTRGAQKQKPTWEIAKYRNSG